MTRTGHEQPRAATTFDLPPLPLAAWQDTKTTLHLYAQIVGKIRMALHPKLNHWWHVTLYLSPRGLTTHAIPTGDGLIELEFDLLDHNLMIRSSDGRHKVVALYDGLSVAQFYHSVLGSLAQLGVEVAILAKPYDPPRVGSDLPFKEDEVHARYDAAYVTRFWRILSWVHVILLEFKGRFYGKSTPVHLFWHSLDLAYTRFSGREAPMQGGSPSDREAYSHEVISFGFWAGDESVSAPTFYGYTYPEPNGLRGAPLLPKQARWVDAGGGVMALLDYDDVRRSEDPRQTLLSFLESTYLAGAKRAGWDVEAFNHDYVDYVPLELP
ncbi:DUF5996 family protein [Truepera radiovictrix]|uniref:Ava_C0101 and related proteins n=1 Tax=Truepera radiovictrix (strain DSM 17093 / CIP 108686 / LMG 22925 / RQ-24) TaxID=649638 RepID=D7CQF6_TRURR|nr:DUF5996 family protein [Truepera radiovictrix]ADI14940.1 conserved hypothetical protein [Truepera radiovictrix DSM 17093]WMT56506.1 DUF5996 family protein [Truepera radiovictrix]